jgi:energy-coupling factor transporter ATP-binding protein EcfA2
MDIPLAYDSNILRYASQQKYIRWDTDLHPNLAILGNSGSGKSYFIRLLMGYISKYAGENAKAYVCCYKNELLKAPAPRFWGYKDVMKGLEAFKAEFELRLTGEPCRDFRLLLIDEYISWLSSLESKEADKVKKSIAEMLFMVRSLNMHLILGCHRGMAADFSHGSRDCLNIIFLGSPSKESVKSFCSTEDSDIIEKRDRGEGYTVFDGQKPTAITVPTVRDMDKLDKAILKLVTD